MKILLTGATGFLGSKILRRLIQRGEEVILVKRTTSNIRRIGMEIEKCTTYNIDEIAIEDIFQKEKPEVVIHCAAAYGRSDKETSVVVEANLMFGIKMLTAAEECGCKYFINTGTFAFKQIARESRIDHPIYMADYTLSKHQFTRWGEAFATHNRIHFITMNLEHIFGEDDDEGKFILYVERNCAANVETIELSDGMQLRDYIYTENVVDAYICVLEHLEKLSGYVEFEVGMGEPVLLKEFVTMIRDISKSNTCLEFGKRPRNDNEPECSVADIKGLQKLGWKPSYSREDGIRQMLKKDKEAGRI